MNEIESHITQLFAGIPESSRKEELKLEITQNLNEKVADLVSAGKTREEAVKKAIDDFGDIEDLKEELESSAKLTKGKRLGLSLAFSIWGSALITALMLFVNFYYTPGNIWFVYPVFAVIWWPMALFFQWYRNKTKERIGFAFSVCSFLLITALMLFINFYYTPDIIWFVYPVFAVLWWPLAMLFRRMRQKNGKEDGFDE
jgi:hypothetical protein